MPEDRKLPISVVLSTYLGEDADNLYQAIMSVITQTRLPDELVVVLDGPIPQVQISCIENIKHEAPIEINVIKLEENAGRGVARNIGVRKAKNELIAIMDSDDICFPYRLEKQYDLYRKYEYDLVCGWQLEFDSDTGKEKGVKKCPENHEDIVNSLKFRCLISNPTVMFKKSAFLDAGGYGDLKNVCEDHLLFVRMALKGYKFYSLQEPLIKVRVSNAQRKRRGGLSSIKDDLRFRSICYKLGFIKFREFLTYASFFIVFRLLPSKAKNIVFMALRGSQ